MAADAERVRGFLANVDFQAEIRRSTDGSLLGATLVAPNHSGRDGRLMEVSHQAGGPLVGMVHLDAYGIMEKPYVDGDGNEVSPARRPSAARDPDLAFQLKSLSREFMSLEETAAFSEAFGRKVDATAAVAEFAATLDLEALHTFEHGLEMADRGRAYAAVAGEGPAATAIKKFGREFPVLAGLAVQIPSLYDAAMKGSTAEESYALLRAAFSAGFVSPFKDALGPARTGPIPDSLLEAVRGLKFDVFSTTDIYSMRYSREFDVPRLVRVLDVARRLPPRGFPRSEKAYGNMALVAGYVAALESEQYVLTESPGRFAFEFSDEDLGFMLADGWLRKFEETPNVERIANKERLDEIGRYGVSLAGPQAPKGDLSPDGLAGRLRALRLDDLKETLVRVGLFEVAGRAKSFARSAEEPEPSVRSIWSM